ncbi:MULTISPECIES: phosphomannomutase/phosphoglucomutase [Sulfurospirillum]|uniref:Phosphomannomutase/phosphoglucomutase n=1 Tax=Sulfurospirillum cavolei TaxID=366522 RepID=A0A2D3W5L7_9BACT|nr:MULTISPECIES: phosphomannomutase/phosphoglucomutase [Sulfurospirillum]KHG33804.1 MAG: phospho-sugar mutase [Sulfurospirillum sp. MES]MCP3653181.1 phosphomannomutase/phosphoglucomutase [Sulfurospirillum sp. DNRA8]MCR1812032.1 phosphomannomutase/phosphoglucomutase [Sulfurospirillum sp. DNRA8]DAB36652.1 MAG TPA: phosphomannomutase/phosphoglucomutase [Sulfurospirillum cavolei]
MKTIFREYDIRGIYPNELNEQTVKLIGYFLGKRILEVGNVVSIGYDARSHSPVLCDNLTSGLNKAGCKVLNMGLVATPVNYFSNFQTFEGLTPNASIMITGSHNPSEYNGFKVTIDKKPFFGEDIYALGAEIMRNYEMEIEDDLSSTFINAKERYIAYMIQEFDHLKGFSTPFVYDCGNGVAGVVVQDIFKGLNFTCKGLFTDPDGTFPNHHPDPTVEKNLKDIKKELEGEFSLGFAYDGDADRIAFLTKKNNVKGDIMAILFSRAMKNPTVIGEVKCSQIMYDDINARGKAIMYKTGHSNLKVMIAKTGADFAAEVSGHLFFNDRYFGYDDAIYATLRMIELVKNGLDVDAEIAKLPVVYSTEELKVETNENDKFPLVEKVKELLKNPPKDFPAIKEIVDVDGVRVIFSDGWGLVRASNTTPVLVTRFESTVQAHAKLYEQKLNALIAQAKEMLASH